MTRKDYLKIANVIAEAVYKSGNQGGQAQWMIDYAYLSHYMCEMLEADNPLFNRQKFIDYIEKVVTEHE